MWIAVDTSWRVRLPRKREPPSWTAAPLAITGAGLAVRAAGDQAAGRVALKTYEVARSCSRSVLRAGLRSSRSRGGCDPCPDASIAEPGQLLDRRLVALQIGAGQQEHARDLWSQRGTWPRNPHLRVPQGREQLRCRRSQTGPLQRMLILRSGPWGLHFEFWHLHQCAAPGAMRPFGRRMMRISGSSIRKIPAEQPEQPHERSTIELLCCSSIPCSAVHTRARSPSPRQRGLASETGP